MNLRLLAELLSHSGERNAGFEELKLRPAAHRPAGVVRQVQAHESSIVRLSEEP